MLIKKAPGAAGSPMTNVIRPSRSIRLTAQEGRNFKLFILDRA